MRRRRRRLSMRRHRRRLSMRRHRLSSMRRHRHRLSMRHRHRSFVRRQRRSTRRCAENPDYRHAPSRHNQGVSALKAHWGPLRVDFSPLPLRLRMAALSAILPLRPFVGREESTLRDIPSHKVSASPPSDPPTDSAPSRAQGLMLRPRWAPDRVARATVLTHPWRRSVDRGGASSLRLGRDRRQGRHHQACHIAGPIERRVSTQPRPRQATCRKDRRGAQ
jgi:hypothetical protein